MDKITRDTIIAYYKGKCQYCGAYPSGEVDHIVSRHKGGRDVLENVTLACSACNKRKSATDLDPMFLSIAHARARDAAPRIIKKLKNRKLPRSLAHLKIVDGVVTAGGFIDFGRTPKQIAKSIIRVCKSGYGIKVEGMDATTEAFEIAATAIKGLDKKPAARARGRKGGRRPKLSIEQARKAAKMLEDNPRMIHEEVAKMFGVSRATLYRTWDRHGITVEFETK